MTKTISHTTKMMNWCLDMAAFHDVRGEEEMADGFRKKAEIDRLQIEALEECEVYLGERQDADCDDTGFIPNEEMKLLVTVRQALGKGR
jgi:hypothetical protein